MKTANEIQNDITKDIHISILKDALNDLRMANVLLKKTMYSILLILALCIVGLVAVSTYYQHRLFTFLETTDFNSEVNMTNEQSNSNNMSIRR